MARGLGKSDMTQLTEALDSLPPELVYLRESILDATRQDQDLLGCGEGEMGTFERIWKKQSADVNPDAHADLLQDWAGRFAQAEWLSPAYWVVGLLRGVSMFGIEIGSESTEPLDFLPRVTMNIPPETKAKQSQYGWKLGDRTVMIDVMGSNTELFQQLSNQYAMVADGRMPSEGMRSEFTRSFQASTVAGSRLVQYLDGNDEPFSACYLLTVPGGYADVRMVAKGRKKQFELSKWEPLLDTIRVIPTRKQED